MRIHSYRTRGSNERADVNSCGIEHKTALHFAVCENKVDAVKILIHYGANIEARTDKGRTALHIASILGETEICGFLLTAGACANCQDKDQDTPCHYAAFYSIFA